MRAFLNSPFPGLFKTALKLFLAQGMKIESKKRQEKSVLLFCADTFRSDLICTEAIQYIQMLLNVIKLSSVGSLRVEWISILLEPINLRVQYQTQLYQ